MSTENHTYYRPNPGFMMREIAGEILLVPVGEQTRVMNGMVTLSETAAFIWKSLDGSRDAAEIAKLLATECGEAVEMVQPDVEEFLQKAFERGLLIIA